MTYIIAEAALSHMGNMEYAERMIHHAVSAGCDAVKFQVYKTEELIDKVRGPERYAEFKQRELSYDQFSDLKRYCELCGIEFIATPHTKEAFYFLDALGVDKLKVGSGDRGEILELALKSGKRTFVSTGMRDDGKLNELIFKSVGHDMVIMHCVTQYPVSTENVNLGVLKKLDRFQKEFGYSDHYPGTYACELAVAMGASVIEKHIRIPESEGQDNSCALNSEELKELVRKIRKIEVMIGGIARNYSQAERDNESWALKGPNGKRPYSS